MCSKHCYWLSYKELSVGYGKFLVHVGVSISNTNYYCIFSPRSRHVPIPYLVLLLELVIHVFLLYRVNLRLVSGNQCWKCWKRCTLDPIHSSIVWRNKAHHVISNSECNLPCTWRTSGTQFTLYQKFQMRQASFAVVFLLFMDNNRHPGIGTPWFTQANGFQETKLLDVNRLTTTFVGV